MLKNYFIVAWRNLFRNPSSSFINVGGLTAGMSVALLIGLWIGDEVSFNTYHKNYDRIARVMHVQTFNGKKATRDYIPFPIGRALQTKFPGDFSHVVMASYQGSHILGKPEKKLTVRGLYMDKEAPDMLSLKMQKGSSAGLNDPHSILLSTSTAKAMYGTLDPIGQITRIDSKLDVKVTGVYEDLPDNTEFADLGFIAPWELYAGSETWIARARDESQWDNFSFQCYVQLTAHADLHAVDQKIHDLIRNNYGPAAANIHSEIFLQPMRDWHLYSHWGDDGRQDGGLIEYVRLFGWVGFFVLLLACINFMNLSTARSERRGREVGIRKAIGSLRSQLIAQFYSESLLTVLLAFACSVFCVWLLLPAFNTLAAKKIVMPWLSPMFWLASVAFVLLTGIIAGSYPALYLSSFRPVKVLKGAIKAGRWASIPRKTLVVVQFTISIVLIIGTVVVYNQLRFTRNRPLGYSRNGVMMIRMADKDFYGKYDLLRTELRNTGAVTDLAESSSPMTHVTENNIGFNWPEKDPNQVGDFDNVYITQDYGKTVGWTIGQGRDFSREFADSASIILNESAVRFMGLKDPIGKIITRKMAPQDRRYTVVGVVKDILMESPYENVSPAIFFMDYENVNWILLRLNPDKSAGESVAKIGDVFRKLIPSAPFNYQFADLEFAKKFAVEERIGSLSAIFAALAIFISCIGLFGLAAFVAEQRTREIGIRKLLGASVTGLWKLISIDFVVLTGISCFMAVPLAIFAMSSWLGHYPYRSPMSWWIFALACGLTMLLAIATVSYQAIRAALANPVDSLKSE
jgi:putative ABC transport system permease protein